MPIPKPPTPQNPTTHIYIYTYKYNNTTCVCFRCKYVQYVSNYIYNPNWGMLTIHKLVLIVECTYKYITHTQTNIYKQIYTGESARNKKTNSMTLIPNRATSPERPPPPFHPLDSGDYRIRYGINIQNLYTDTHNTQSSVKQTESE